MAGFDDLINPDANKLLGTDLTFTDADTLVGDDGQKYRFRGVDAPEIHHPGVEGSKQEVGGVETTSQVVSLANKMGFTNVVPIGDKDKYGRQVIDLQDKNGRSFKQQLASQGIVPVHPGYDPGGNLGFSKKYGEFLRTDEQREITEWDKARELIDQSVREEQKYVNQFKTAQTYSGQAYDRESGEFYDHLNKHVADFQYKDRSVDKGNANNPFSTAWNTGWIGVSEAMYGVANLIGDKTGVRIPGVDFKGEWHSPSSWGLDFDSESLSDIGLGGVNRAQTRIQDQGHILTDYKDVVERDAKGNLQLSKSFGNALDFITNNAAISVPYMAISLGGAALAPVTGGLSLAAPASIYTGQTWNEMEGEKSASVAITSGIIQASLDRLGIGFIFKSTKAPAALVNEAVEKLVQRGMTKEAAQNAVASATRSEIAGFAGDAAKMAARQLKAKAIFQDLSKRVLIGGTGEGITEALQESTAYLGATLGSDKVFDWEELNERAIAAAVAGSTLGSSFSVAGSAVNTGAWADVAFRTAPAEAKRLSEAGKYADEEVKQHGRVKSVQELAAETRAKVNAGTTGATFDERVEADKQRKKNRSFGDTVTDLALSAPALWRGATRWIFSPEIQGQSRSARILADMFGANLQRTFSGSNYENSKHHRVTMYKNLSPLPQKTWAILNNGKAAGRRRRGEISDEVYKTLRAAVDPKTGKFDPNKVPQDTAHRDTILKIQRDFQALSDKMWADQKQFNPTLGKLNNYLLKYKAFNKRAIQANKLGFKQALRKKFGITDAEASSIAEAITNNAEINDIDEAFSIVKGGVAPGSHKKRTLGLSELDEFNEFMEKDLFANASAAAKSAARYVTHKEFVGQNASVISQLLNQMQDEGVPANIVNKVAAQMQDYLDAESGNYKRPTTDAGRAFQKVQRNFMMFTTLAGLPLATISSFVELALTMKGLTNNQIFGKKGGLAYMGKELADTLWNGMTTVSDAATGRTRENSDSEGKERIRDLGFYDWDVGAATTTGATEINPWQQDIYEIFFKATGLQGWTNYTRAVRAGIAGDYIMEKINVIQGIGDVKTNEQQQAEEALRTLGINVQDMVGLVNKMATTGQLDPQEQAVLESNLREASFNFVNEAVALPQAANRPLIYQDPRFALFTQFQGFIATFTANHIPKLWGEYVKRGTPAMKYNAFAVMTTMIMLGFASQHLKDLLKYGGSSPYVEGPDYIQRGIRASGLLGTSERVLDQFFPIYESRSDGAGEWIFNETSSQSPALSNLARLGKAGGSLLQGDVGKFAKNVGKSFPVLGPFTSINEFIGDKASNWNFKGGS